MCRGGGDITSLCLSFLLCKMGLTSFLASRVALKCVITLLLYHVGATAPSSHSEPTHPCWAGPTARARPCLSGPESPLCASLATLLRDLQTHPESAAGRVHCVAPRGGGGAPQQEVGSWVDVGHRAPVGRRGRRVRSPCGPSHLDRESAAPSPPAAADGTARSG